jgi:hypothetical protein
MRWRYAVAAFETTRASRRPWDVDVRPAIRKGPHRCGPLPWWSCRESNPFRGAGLSAEHALSCEMTFIVIHQN